MLRDHGVRPVAAGRAAARARGADENRGAGVHEPELGGREPKLGGREPELDDSRAVADVVHHGPERGRGVSVGTVHHGPERGRGASVGTVHHGAEWPGGSVGGGRRRRSRRAAAAAAERQDRQANGVVHVLVPVRLHRRGGGHEQRADHQGPFQLRSEPGTVHPGGPGAQK